MVGCSDGADVLRLQALRPTGDVELDLLPLLEGAEAVKKYRALMGATNPSQADQGTLRRDFAESIEANSVHGSDSEDSAQEEIAFFFAAMDIVG